jgi:hypothetical protein
MDKKHKDYNMTFILEDADKLPRVNVGNTYTVMSVNRQTRQVVLNPYSFQEWANPNKLMLAEDFLELFKKEGDK